MTKFARRDQPRLYLLPVDMRVWVSGPSSRSWGTAIPLGSVGLRAERKGVSGTRQEYP